MFRERVHWSIGEWAALCKKLQEQQAGNSILQAQSVDELTFSRAEFYAAMSVLSKSRRRKPQDIDALKRRLLIRLPEIRAYLAKPSGADEHAQALAPAAATEAASAKGKRANIVYTPDEWRKLATTLVGLFPDQHFCADNLEGLQSQHLRIAMQAAVQPDRQRQIISVLHFKKPLIKAFLSIADRPVTSTMAAPAEPVITFPLDLSTLDVKARLLDGKQDGPPVGRVVWREPHYFYLAMELLRLDPQLATSEGLVRLSVRALNDAQRVLPTSLRRRFRTVAALRPALLQAVRRVMEAAAAQDARREADRIAAEQESAAAAQAEAEARAAQLAAEAAERAQAAELLQWGAACKPFIEFMAAQIGKSVTESLVPAMQSALDSAVRQVLAQLPQQMATLAASTAAPASGTTDIADAVPAAGTPSGLSKFIDRRLNEAKLPKIALAGMLPNQEQEIRKAYPQLRVVGLGDGRSYSDVKDIVSHCDKVIGMVRFMSKTLDLNCSKAAGEKYARVSGGTSQIRRQIDVWLATGELAPRAVAH